MASHIKSAHYPSLSANDRLPTKITPSPISPAYALALRIIYRQSRYNHFLPSPPEAKTSIRCPSTCHRKGKRHREPSKPHRWEGEREVNMHVYTTNPRGILSEQDVQMHDLKEMCGSSHRGEAASQLDLQTGDLKGPMFKQRLPPLHSPPPSLPDESKEEKADLPPGFEPFLLRTLSDNTITKASFPAPYNTYSKKTFTHWFVKSMKMIGHGKEFSLKRLELMRQHEAQQEEKQRRKIADEAQRLQEKLAEERRNMQEARNELYERFERNYVMCGIPVPERAPYIEEPVTQLELDIRARLRVQEEERKARREAARASKRQAREERERREENERHEENKRRKERSRSCMGWLTRPFTALWR